MRDSDLDLQLRLYTLHSKMNPDDPEVKELVGSRKGACYDSTRAPTTPEIAKAARDLRAILVEENMRHKRHKVWVERSMSAVPLSAGAAFTDKLVRQRGRKRTNEAEAPAPSAFDAMDHELAPQAGV
jgi:hypothetical protein